MTVRFDPGALTMWMRPTSPTCWATRPGPARPCLPAARRGDRCAGRDRRGARRGVGPRGSHDRGDPLPRPRRLGSRVVSLGFRQAPSISTPRPTRRGGGRRLSPRPRRPPRRGRAPHRAPRQLQRRPGGPGGGAPAGSPSTPAPRRSIPTARRASPTGRTRWRASSPCIPWPIRWRATATPSAGSTNRPHPGIRRQAPDASHCAYFADEAAIAAASVTASSPRAARRRCRRCGSRSLSWTRRALGDHRGLPRGLPARGRTHQRACFRGRGTGSSSRPGRRRQVHHADARLHGPAALRPEPPRGQPRRSSRSSRRALPS